ncbi:CHAD domain-containing protein [Thiofaba sp. EF100]|uniref:CHAD domain-containing protein n=1 Tax=Thiofaba sp. EF100 TaxID=3121274 RepID=UPI0032217DC4
MSRTTPEVDMLTLDDLQRPVADVCLTILHQRLQEVLTQGALLRKTPSAEEALHDTRVAVRRARVWLKLCAPLVDIPRKARRALRSFARESGPVRDLEVQEAWLAGVQLRGRERHGWQALRERLAGEHAAHRAALLDTLPEMLEGAQRALERMRPLEGADRESFGAWMAERWMDAATPYLADMHHLPEGLHPLRLVGKQLRYMLEPLATALEAKDVLRHLRQGQDALGRVNDAGVLAAALPAHAAALLARRFEEDIHYALEQGEAPRWQRPAIWPGLRAVSQALLDERGEALAAVHGWRLSAGDALAEGLPRIGVQLAGSSAFDGFGNPR